MHKAPFSAVASLGQTGFSRTDLLILIGAVTLFCGLALGWADPTRRVRRQLSCYQNLREIGLAIPDYAQDHDGRTPWEISTNNGGTLEYGLSGAKTFRHFQVQANYINAWVVLLCPQDNRGPALSWEDLANTNISYFVGLDSDPKRQRSIMAGDRNITATSSSIVGYNSAAPPQWVKSVGLHGDKGHVVFGDGHVEELDSPGLASALEGTGGKRTASRSLDNSPTVQFLLRAMRTTKIGDSSVSTTGITPRISASVAHSPITATGFTTTIRLGK